MVARTYKQNSWIVGTSMPEGQTHWGDLGEEGALVRKEEWKIKLLEPIEDITTWKYRFLKFMKHNLEILKSIDDALILCVLHTLMPHLILNELMSLELMVNWAIDA